MCTNDDDEASATIDSVNTFEDPIIDVDGNENNFLTLNICLTCVCLATQINTKSF